MFLFAFKNRLLARSLFSHELAAFSFFLYLKYIKKKSDSYLYSPLVSRGVRFGPGRSSRVRWMMAGDEQVEGLEHRREGTYYNFEYSERWRRCVATITVHWLK